MTQRDNSTRISNNCRHCGIPHLYAWKCRYNLHGKVDSFKTSCAICNSEILSGAQREGDRFGNLYCSVECANQGHEMLLDISMESDQESVVPQSSIDFA